MKAMKTVFIILLFLVFILGFCVVVYAQSDLEVGRLTVRGPRGFIDITSGGPIWTNGFIRGSYSGTAYDAIYYNYTGSGNYLMRLQGDGSDVFTLDKSGNIISTGDMSVTGTLSAKSIPGATITVAASNSRATGKALADYVCHGVNDASEIQTAIEAVEALGGGKVLCLEGSYNINIIARI